MNVLCLRHVTYMYTRYVVPILSSQVGQARGCRCLTCRPRCRFPKMLMASFPGASCGGSLMPAEMKTNSTACSCISSAAAADMMMGSSLSLHEVASGCMLSRQAAGGRPLAPVRGAGTHIRMPAHHHAAGWQKHNQ